MPTRMDQVSAGPLPSGKAFAAVSKDELVKAYYQTTSMREVPGRTPNAECVGENFIDVHSIGKKTTKYLDFQVSKSPLTQRDCCKYTQDFIPLPLGDNVINKAMAQSFKGGLAAGGRNAIDVPMNTRTKYEDEYKPVEREAMRGAVQRNQKPKQAVTNTLGGTDKLLETTSFTQAKFVTPNLELAKAERAAQPRPGLDIGGGVKHAGRKTAYQREHGPAQVAAARAMARSASTPELESLGFPPMHRDPAIFQIRRGPFLMPGK